MIDPDKVRRFWEGRAESLDMIALESMANLEQDADKLRLKIDDETAKVFDWLPDLAGLSVLDLGAGVGQWSVRFAQCGARRVLAVEYAEGLAEIGLAAAKSQGCDAIEFEVSSAEDFDTDERFDLVFISGLFVYLTDGQADRLVGKLGGFVASGGRLMLRDGTGVAGRHEIDDHFSEHLGTQYSATYRTRQQYLALLDRCGVDLERDDDMFAEGHPLNKYPETRLRLYLARMKRS